MSGAQFHSTPEGWARAVMFNWCSAAHWCVREFLKHAIPDYLVRSTDLFALRLSNKKLTTANITIAIQCEQIKIKPIFVRSAKNIIHFFHYATEFWSLVYGCHEMQRVKTADLVERGQDAAKCTRVSAQDSPLTTKGYPTQLVTTEFEKPCLELRACFKVSKKI